MNNPMCHSQVDEKPEIVIVEDDQHQLKGLRRLLSAMGYRVRAFTSGQEFLQHAMPKRACCIILDIHLPDISGLDIQKELLRRKHFRSIVFLTAHSDVSSGVRAIKSGAVNFLQKPVDTEELQEALEEAIENDRRHLMSQSRLNMLKEKVSHLTDREMQVFRHIITGRLNKQIAYDLHITEKTVKVHRSRVKEKLGVVSVAHLVRIAEEVGIQPAF